MSSGNKHSAFAISIVGLDDDLRCIVDDINNASWDNANEMTSFDESSLTAYLKRQDTCFITCYDNTSTNKTLLGIASSRIQIKPYAKEKWLYVDELDVCANQRRQGAGTAIMLKLLELAKSTGCTEVWLGTEVDNMPANALYSSVDPDDVEQFIGYTFEVDT